MKRSLFEVIKDLFVAATLIIKNAIETVFQAFTSGFKNNISEKNILKDSSIKTSANAIEMLERLKDTIRKDQPNPHLAESAQSKKQYSSSIIEATQETIKTNIDFCVSKNGKICEFKMGESEYEMYSTPNEQQDGAEVKIVHKESGKEVISQIFSIKENPNGDKEISFVPATLFIKDLSEIGIIDEERNEKISQYKLINEIKESAKNALENQERYFVVNGHLFDTKIDKSNQVVVFSEGKRIIKWPKDDEKKLDINYKNFEPMINKGETVIIQAPKDIEEFNNVLKAENLEIKKIKNGKAYISTPNGNVTIALTENAKINKDQNEYKAYEMPKEISSQMTAYIVNYALLMEKEREKEFEKIKEKILNTTSIEDLKKCFEENLKRYSNKQVESFVKNCLEQGSKISEKDAEKIFDSFKSSELEALRDIILDEKIIKQMDDFIADKQYDIIKAFENVKSPDSAEPKNALSFFDTELSVSMLEFYIKDMPDDNAFKKIATDHIKEIRENLRENFTPSWENSIC